ncbi:MAG: hypothetical protein K8T26_00620 [Lentisphaerae bacterium]|nr:hypothetical protein [Lentisphaerota bacterium]
MANELVIELCGDTGCGLYMTEVDDTQYRISLMPDECLEARALCGDPAKLKEFLLTIEPGFAPAIEALGITAIAQSIRTKKLPAILQRMADKQ